MRPKSAAPRKTRACRLKQFWQTLACAADFSNVAGTVGVTLRCPEAARTACGVGTHVDARPRGGNFGRVGCEVVARAPGREFSFSHRDARTLSATIYGMMHGRGRSRSAAYTPRAQRLQTARRCQRARRITQKFVTAALAKKRVSAFKCWSALTAGRGCVASRLESGTGQPL
jgi:hypothetical protein